MNRSTVISIIALMVTAFTIGIDFTGVLLLIPAIENAFAVDITTTQWVLNLYALSFSVFMITGGRLGDLYGRKYLMVLGLCVFSAATIACLLAPTIGWLIAARGVQGIGAAMIWPSLLAQAGLVTDEDNRSFIIGLVLAGVTTGNVVGPLIGGFVDTLGDWRLFFLVNAALAAIAGVLVLSFIPVKRQEKSNQKIDYWGIAVAGGAIMALLYALDVGADWGWTSAALLLLFAASAALFVMFPVVESKVLDPMIPVPMMRNTEFMLTVAANALMMPAVYTAFLYVPQLFQKVFGWSVMQASFGMLPLMVLLAIGSIFSGRFYDRIGPKRLMLFGYALITIATASVVLLPQSWGYLGLFPAMVMMGLGASIAIGSSGTAAMAAVLPSRTGLVGGLTFTVHLAFGAVGVAIATAVMYSQSLSKIGEVLAKAGVTMSPTDMNQLTGAAHGSETVTKILANYDQTSADKIRQAMSDSFTSGLTDAYWMAFAWAALGVLVVLAINESKLKKVKDFDAEVISTD